MGWLSAEITRYVTRYEPRPAFLRIGITSWLAVVVGGPSSTRDRSGPITLMRSLTGRTASVKVSVTASGALASTAFWGGSVRVRLACADAGLE
jgi:hypothetical protein